MSFESGSLVRARNRDWVVLPSPDEDLILLRPLGGSDAETTAIYKPLGFPEDRLQSISFPYPSVETLGSFDSAKLLYDATRLSFRNGAGPFRCFGKLSFRPRAYQIIPLIMALRLDVIRLMIADDVGIGKTIEAGLIARELLDRGEISNFAVICLPHLCEQWQEELKNKFGLEAVIVRSGNVSALEKHLPGDTTIYRHYPFQVISVDYAKSDAHRHQFIHECPDFVIVDEVHSCANTTGKQDSSQQQRHRLLKTLAEKSTRHLVMLTATPHSGKQEEFQSLLGLLKPEFADSSFSFDHKENMKKVADYFVQRKRTDIKKYLYETTQFPERDAGEIGYDLSPGYKAFYNNVLTFSRELIKSDGVDEKKQRFRYWAALSLLRGVMSSPGAGMEMLKKRAFNLDDESARMVYEDKADNPVMDHENQTRDALPTEVIDQNEFTKSEITKLKALSDELEKLSGIHHDLKAAATTKVVKEWIGDGFQPVVFCRFIETAKYLGAVLETELSSIKGLNVEIITGEIPDDLRREKIEAMKGHSRRLLVCTDCLSEGINLQEGFNAVLHYDLPWNPNRLEQREGRIDRFGQNAPKVKAYLLYGKNNPIDGVVLKVLLRKAREIRESIGISVPFPEDSQSILDAVMQAVLRHPKMTALDTEQLGFDFMADTEAGEAAITVANSYAKAKEKQEQIRNQFAQYSIGRSVDIESDLKRTDEILGNPKAVEHFVIQAVRHFGAQIDTYRNGYKLFTTNLPPGLKFLLGEQPEVLISFESPTPEGYRYIGRNHAFVEQLCQHCLKLAFDSKPPIKVSRSAVFRTDAVKTKSVIAMLRIRNVIAKANRSGEMVAEEAILWGYRSDAASGDYLSSEEAGELLRSVAAKGDIGETQKINFLLSEIEAIKNAGATLNGIAKERSLQLVESHERYRKALGVEKYGVGTIVPPDVLGIYILFPL